MQNTKQIIYKGCTIDKCITGWYSVFTSRYGYLKADSLAGIKRLINQYLKAPMCILLLCILSFGLQAQTVVKMDAKGNYTAVQKTAKEGQSKAKDTGKTYTDSKGKIYPVYESAKGKLFIIRQSAKTGKNYNQYISLTPKN